jgi:hypothetical protein
MLSRGILSEAVQTRTARGIPDMSTRTSDETTNTPGDDEQDHDCVALDLEDGQVILYDPAETGAWLQSDVYATIQRSEEPRPTR